MRWIRSVMGLALLISPVSVAEAQSPVAVAAAGETLLATIQAQGAQVYECKAETSGKLAWLFREPIATLLFDGQTVGRHFAGPSWELVDGSIVAGKVVARAPGATADDIPILRLEVTSRGDGGQLAAATTILRLNTRGGIVAGPCERAGALASVPYSADYAFYSKNN
jgi:hypothetical protein